MLDEAPTTWRQAGRDITPEELAYIRTFAKRFPGLSRTELTATLCEHLDWLTPAGRPKFQACSKLLARLEAAGQLRRPALDERFSHPGPRARAAPRAGAPRQHSSVVSSLSALAPVRLRLVSDRDDEHRFNDALAQSHPLGYKKPFGYWARYFIESSEHWLGCVLLSGAAKALRARDRWIGWSERQRLANLPWVASPLFETDPPLLTKTDPPLRREPRALADTDPPNETLVVTKDRAFLHQEALSGLKQAMSETLPRYKSGKLYEMRPQHPPPIDSFRCVRWLGKERCAASCWGRPGRTAGEGIPRERADNSGYDRGEGCRSDLRNLTRGKRELCLKKLMMDVRERRPLARANTDLRHARANGACVPTGPCS